MQKKIIALAIAAAFAAPVAMADTANVNIYGTVGMSADNVSGNTNASDNETRGRISSNNSFIGFKGSEDLGDGLSAVWQYETAIAFDMQTTADIPGSAVSPVQGGQSKRNTFGGLSSKTLGTLTLGLQDTPLKISTGPLAVFTNTLADYRTLFTTGPTSVRAPSSAMYVSPSMGGFVARALYGAQNEAGNTTAASDSSLYSVSGTYTQGPIFAVLAAENTKAVAAGNAITATRASRAGFGYTFGDAKLGVAMENNDVSNNAGVKSVNVRSYYVSASYQMGLNSVKAAVTKRADNKVLGNENGATQLTIGVDRALSKRTTVYALATRVQNENNGTYGLAGGATGIASVASATDRSARGIALGMSHTF